MGYAVVDGYLDVFYAGMEKEAKRNTVVYETETD